MTQKKPTEDDISTKTLIRDLIDQKDYKPHDAYACPNYEQKFSEQWNKKSLKTIGIVAGSILALAGSILGVYISMTSDIISLKKDVTSLSATTDRIEKNQLTVKELGEAIAVGLKPIIEQIRRESEINYAQEKDILRLNFKVGETK